MRQITKFMFVAALAAVPTMASALETLQGSVNEDLYYQGGVLLQGVTLPNDLTAQTGSSTITIEGAGTVTVASRAGNGFPKMMILGGTTITSTRTWAADESNKSWWEGQLDAPGVGRKPTTEEVSFVNAGAHAGSTLYPVSAYQLGISNEIFSFSVPVHVAFPVQEMDGTKIWIAKNDTGTWKIADSDYCIIENGVCVTQFSTFGAVGLIKENLQKCPTTQVENGEYSGAPSCILQCNRGYLPNETWTACVAIDPNAVVENDVVVDGVTSGNNFTAGGINDIRTWRHGYFRYRDTRAQSSRYLDEDLVEGAALDRVRRLNDGYLSRNPRSSKEQLCEGAACGGAVVEGGTNDAYLNYLLQVRNTFNDSINLVNDCGDTCEEDVVIVEDGEGQTVNNYSGGATLPSTGPSTFIVLVVLGIGFMVFRVIRKEN